MLFRRTSFIGITWSNYTDIKVGNKATNKSIEEIGGLHTSGEFGSILAVIFNPDTGTDFTRPSQVDMHGRKSYAYKFEVRESARIGVL